jgi:hypothetical protein
LGRFITTAEHKQQHRPTLYEINAIAGPKMNPHLADTSPNRLHVAKIVKLNGVETSKLSEHSRNFDREPLIDKSFLKYGREKSLAG